MKATRTIRMTMPIETTAALFFDRRRKASWVSERPLGASSTASLLA